MDRREGAATVREGPPRVVGPLGTVQTQTDAHTPLVELVEHRLVQQGPVRDELVHHQATPFSRPLVRERQLEVGSWS